MPRRKSTKDDSKLPPRPLRRSSRFQTNPPEESSASMPSQSQATPTASTVAPLTNSLSQQQDITSSGSMTQETSSLPQLETHSSLTLNTRKRDVSSHDDGHSSRKKGRLPANTTARVSLDIHNDDSSGRDSHSSQASQASPEQHVKHSSTITPAGSGQTNARMEEQDVSGGPSMGNLLGNNDLEASRSSTTSSLSAQLKHQKDLPEGVVDLYPSDSSKQGTCKSSYCVTKSLTDSFLSSYGLEYFQNLRGQEEEDASSETSSMNHTQSTDHESLSLSPHSASQHVVSIASRTKPVLGSSPLVGDLETLDRQPHLTEKMRAILIDWMVELSEEYKLCPQTLQLAVALVDKSLACGAPTLAQEGPASGYFTVKRDMLQCVGCACMWIASKMEEIEPPCAMDFVYISDNSYTKEQITDMELTVCTALEFRLSQVVPTHFLTELLRASCACGDPSCSAAENAILKHMVLYLLELSLLPAELAYTNPSLKAAAAVYVARVTLGIRSGGGYWSKTLKYYSGYDLADLEETAMTIHRNHCAAEESQLRTCFVKFSKAKYSSVALKTVPLESELGF